MSIQTRLCSINLNDKYRKLPDNTLFLKDTDISELEDIDGTLMASIKGKLYIVNVDGIKRLVSSLNAYPSIIINEGSGVYKDSVVIGVNATISAKLDDSVVVGFKAGQMINRGGAHLILGKEAGQHLLTGDGNHLFGYRAGNTLRNGDNNLIWGNNTARDISESTENMVIGHDALKKSLPIGGNMAFGIGSMGNCSDVAENIAFGKRSLYSINDNRNIAIGHLIGENLKGKMCRDNILLGHGCFSDPNTDELYSYSNNIVSGIDACRSCSGSMFYNIIFGKDACRNVNSDILFSNNILFGKYVCRYAKNLSNMVVIGSEAGTNLTGQKGVIIGYQSCHEISGELGGDIIIGNNAGSYRLFSDITNQESKNIIMGWEAGSGNKDQFSTGNSSILIGVRAGYSAKRINYCVGFGDHVLENSTQDYSICFGENSGKLSKGINNIYMGGNRGYGIDGSHNILLGQTSSNNSIKLSNSVIIGNDIVGGNNNIIISRGLLKSDDVHNSTFAIGIDIPYLFGDLNTGVLALAPKNLDENWGDTKRTLYLENTNTGNTPPTGDGSIIFQENGKLMSWTKHHIEPTMVCNQQNTLKNFQERIFNSGNIIQIDLTSPRVSGNGGMWVNLKLTIYSEKLFVEITYHIVLIDGVPKVLTKHDNSTFKPIVNGSIIFINGELKSTQNIGVKYEVFHGSGVGVSIKFTHI
jgi:hypothetical protein